MACYFTRLGDQLRLQLLGRTRRTLTTQACLDVLLQHQNDSLVLRLFLSTLPSAFPASSFALNGILFATGCSTPDERACHLPCGTCIV